MTSGRGVNVVLVAALVGLVGCASGPVPHMTLPNTPTGLTTSATPTTSPTGQPQPATAGSTPRQSCDERLWAHVYHPQRLKVVNRCVTVTGTIDVVRTEADGDRHILLHLDPNYASMVNPVNVAKQHGDLVLEPVCEGPVTQADAKAACAGYRSPVVVPPVGTHVAVIGAYVTDSEHGGWAEVHPVTSITNRG